MILRSIYEGPTCDELALPEVLWEGFSGKEPEDTTER